MIPFAFRYGNLEMSNLSGVAIAMPVWCQLCFL